MSRRRAKTRPRRQPQEPQPARKHRSPPWSVIGVLLGIGVIANVVVWSRPAADPAADYPEYSAELVARGEQAFQANCATCHGPDGSGDAAAGVPALNGSMHAWHHPDSQIAGLIRRGGSRCPPWDRNGRTRTSRPCWRT
jgi:mono/diheme cytochrome c family protein